MTFLKICVGAAAAVAMFALPQSARADGEGVYFGAALGGLLVSEDTTSGATSYETTFMPGYVGSGFVGYELPLLPIRLEGEVTYRNTDFDDLKAFASAALDTNISFPASGSLNSLAFMANAYTFLPMLFLEPYIGVGVGYSQVKADNIQAAGVSVLDGSDWGLAYQGIVGVELDIIPGPIDFGVEYRYFATEDITFSGEGSSTTFDYITHSIMAKIRYSL